MKNCNDGIRQYYRRYSYAFRSATRAIEQCVAWGEYHTLGDFEVRVLGDGDTSEEIDRMFSCITITRGDRWYLSYLESKK